MVGSMIPVGVQPQAEKICAEVEQYNPGKVRNVWGYNSTPDHNNRKCVDYMIYDKVGGDQITQYHLDNRKRLLVDLIIWNRRIIRSYDKPGIKAWTWAPYSGKSPHTDHPHVQYKPGIYVAPSGSDLIQPPVALTKVKVDDVAIVMANGSLNGRAEPNENAAIVTRRPYGDNLLVKAVQDNWAQEAGNLGAWYSMDYLYPKVTPDPVNAAGIKKGDKVRVTASGGLTARILPGGPKATDSSGKNIVRPTNYQFTVTSDPSSAWVTGGSNWYSTDYLAKVQAPTPPTTQPPKPVPPVGKPAWSSKPTIVLPMSKVPGVVNYLQGVVRVAAVTTSEGKKIAQCWVLAQDPNNKGDTRFLLFSSTGIYQGYMIVKKGGHGSTFHAYRSSAGNLYVWTLIGNVAYRIKWQAGKTITPSSAGVSKMAYGTARPVGTYEHFVGFRAANDTHETFTIHDRFGFTDPDNNSDKPLKKVKVAKRTSYTQQTWALTDTRIYRFMGKTNTDAPKGSRKHILDVFDWSGRLLLDRFDLTAMAIPTTSDEPEGLTFSGTPGNVMAGKREGSNDKTKRSYPIWTLTGLP